MVNKSDIYVNDKVYPKRVLDVKATLASNGGFVLVVPTSWDFHIISHTWTDGIRALVKDCGTIMESIAWTREGDPDGQIYTSTVASSDFSSKSYYTDVTSFLAVLGSDGVERVWLDAVCINQYDSVEMSSEMHYMGGFYSLSNACYVAPHGIGSPYGFKALTTDNALPRWFSRVWTLQEYMLPEKLYFLVEKFDDKVIEYIKNEDNSHPEDKVWVDWDNCDDISKLLNLQTPGNYSRRKVTGVPSATNLYFIGAMAYFEMMGTILAVHVHGLNDVSPKLYDDFYEAFGELAGGVEDIYMETLVKQIRVRYATSEEDRVMGILGLIGFKGDYELQTNQTLDAQVIALAKLLFKQKHVSNLLVNMCAAEYEGYEVAGISWAPDLTADPDTSKAEFRRYFTDSYVMVKEDAATVTGVQEDGALIMKAQMAKGTLMKQADNKSGTTYVLKVGLFSIKLIHDSDITDNLPIHADDSKDRDHSGWVGGAMIAAPGIHNFKGYKPQESFPICEVALVFLGTGNAGSAHKPRSTCILMACISLGNNKFHKIGALHPYPSLASRARKLFLNEATEFIVGGVGGDVTPYLHEQCQTALKSLTTSSA